MMKSVIGFEVLYALGITCSKIPPCGVARTVLEADADVDAAVMVVVRIEVTVAILRQPKGSPGRMRLRRNSNYR